MTPADPDRERPLWQAALDYLRRHPSASDPAGRDRPLVDGLFVELYVLGERPSVDEVHDYLCAAGVPEGPWRRGLIRVWRDRLEHPARRSRRIGGWAYPFVVPETLVAELGVRSVPDRLADAARAAAADYMLRAGVEPGADETHTAGELHEITSFAVRLWALSRDRIDGVEWRSPVQWPKATADIAEYATRTGRARAELRVEALLRRRDEEETSARARGEFDDKGSP